MGGSYELALSCCHLLSNYDPHLGPQRHAFLQNTTFIGFSNGGQETGVSGNLLSFAVKL